ncbi:hypothetical protein CYLTODRAFT_493867 [Cylindrobasidium torrendii FP15055 ss-10]|uniref:Arrestin-like N-terminal domain-containing protein n=1 Tax=Cylindrobasidium torrendii FP15055 ss-10 TaxID=1314674 RepID=A0A0D7AZ47_9AGAR|nr:hypothetical protein CYLTODRAFT_493867 [Cylindrobasidium torrendii FP15055 ss-10]
MTSLQLGSLYSARNSDFPPAYDVVSPPPKYSPDPASGEERVQQVPRASGSQPTGSYIATRGSVTVVLNDQADDATEPVYSRLGRITGAILIDSHDTVASIHVKLLGRLDYVSSDGGTSVQTVSREATVWDGCSAVSEFSGNAPLSLVFPSSYKHDGKDHPLPPSFVYSPHGLPMMLVTSTYSLCVTVSYTRRNMSFIPKTKTIRIPIRYQPRTRPGQPIFQVPLFCGIKSSPGEWQQSICDIKQKAGSSLSPIVMNVLLLSTPIFGICDRIPIHVQISGALESLRCLLPDPNPPTANFEPPKVYLTRQIIVENSRSRTSRSIVIGEGKIMSIPPTTSQLDDEDHSNDVLDWEGEVTVDCGIARTGGFTASGVSVRDFIHVVIRAPPSSPFQTTMIYIPIRLVTDSWQDAPGW